MWTSLSRALAAVVAIGLVGFAPAAGAAATLSCGKVVYTAPNTGNKGKRTLNNLTAANISCSSARSVAKSFLAAGTAPKGWHVSGKTIVKQVKGKKVRVAEVILTRGKATVIGEPVV
jgi:hypothetical protein